MINEDIWDITNRQQTQIKLDILEKYIKAWAIIVGSHYPEAYFIDCFAGRGMYHKDGAKDIVLGSPLIGLKTALAVKELKKKKGINFDLNIIAIEPNNNNMKDLKRFVEQKNINNDAKVDFINKEFEDALSDVLSRTSGKPSFCFIDPYGVKSISKKSIDKIIKRKGSTEIFLNYMKMGVQRISGQLKSIDHEDEAIRIKAIKTITHLNDLFGDMSWANKEEAELLKHFVQNVLGENYSYVLNFHVPYTSRSGTIYNLLFATNYKSGEKIMREIMTKKLFTGTLFEKCPYEIDLNAK